MAQKVKYIKLKRKNKRQSNTPKPRFLLPEMGFDKPLIAALSGIFALIPHIIYTYFLKKFGYIIWDFSQIGAAVASNNQITKGWQVYLIGNFQNAILAALMGTLFYYSLFIIGPSQIYFKGITFASVVWMVTRSIYLYLFKIPAIIYSKSFFILAYYIGIFSWGLILAFLVKKYALTQVPAKEKVQNTTMMFVPVPARKPARRKTFRKTVKPRKI